ncbi:type 4b pilus protein PilO2 [Escherichia coli]
MFDKMFDKFRKKSELTSDSKIRVLKINKRRFVVGLEWQTIKLQANMMKAVKAIGKAKNLDVVAIRKSDAYQAGFAPKTKQQLRGGYSLSVALTSLLKECCIAVVHLGNSEAGEAEYTVVGRSSAGGIHPMSDFIICEADLLQSVIDMKGQLRGNNENLDIPIYGDQDRFEWVTAQLDLNTLLMSGNISKDFKLKPLTMGMTDERLIFLAATCLMSLVAVFFIHRHIEGKELEKQQQQNEDMKAQAELNKKARYQTALKNLSHPWITKPSVLNFITECRKGLYRLSPSVVGWIPVQANCTEYSLSAEYLRPQNSVATTSDFIDAIKEKFGVGVAFNYANTSLTSFSISHDITPEGDDPMDEMGNQLVKMISLFQSMNIAANFSEVQIKDKLRNDLGEEMPLQEWQEYNFTVSTAVSPQLIFKSDDFKGVRLKDIIYKFDVNGTTLYNITGVIYGIRPKDSYPKD